jgi:type I restriction enzyme S subunit
MMRIRPTGETTSEFLEMVLQSAGSRRQIHAAASGTSESMVKISAAVLRGLRIPYVPLPEQQRILRKMTAVSQVLAAEERALAKALSFRTALADDLLTGRVRVTPLLAAAGPELEGVG